MSTFTFGLDLLDDLSCIIPFPPPFLFLVLLLHYSASFGRYIILLQSWGLQSLSSPDCLLIRSHLKPCPLIVYFFRTFLTLLVTSAFSYLPSVGSFLAPWKLMRPAPPPWAVEQVDLIALDCARMNLQEFMLFPGPCRGPTGQFLLFLLFVCILFRGVRGLVWPFSLRRFGR